MNYLISAAILFLPFTAMANKKIDTKSLPKAVSQSVSSYFPNSPIKFAELESRIGKKVYELNLVYKDLNLEIEVDEDGKIVDLDLND